jgi:hypothetical protein
MKATLIRMLTVSFFMAILTSLVPNVLLSQRTIPTSDFDYKKMEAMSFRDAMQYSRDHTQTVSGFKSYLSIFRIRG